MLIFSVPDAEFSPNCWRVKHIGKAFADQADSNKKYLHLIRAGHATMVEHCDNDNATTCKSFSDNRKFEKMLRPWSRVATPQ